MEFAHHFVEGLGDDEEHTRNDATRLLHRALLAILLQDRRDGSRKNEDGRVRTTLCERYW